MIEIKYKFYSGRNENYTLQYLHTRIFGKFAVGRIL